MAPYIPWNMRKAKTPQEQKAKWNRAYRRRHRAVGRNNTALRTGLEKLGEYMAARQWLNDLPHYLWFPHNRSVECLLEFQAQGRMHDNA